MLGLYNRPGRGRKSTFNERADGADSALGATLAATTQTSRAEGAGRMGDFGEYQDDQTSAESHALELASVAPLWWEDNRTHRTWQKSKRNSNG